MTRQLHLCAIGPHMRRLLFVLGLTACLPGRAAEHLVPPYVPRYVFLGTFVGSAVTPQLRVGWDVTALQQRGDALTVIAEIGGGYATSYPAIPREDGSTLRMNFLYQFAIVAGLGYRGDRGVLHWGIHVGLGPLFYGAHYLGEGPERRVVVTVEGRAELGYRINGKVAVGFSAGLSSPLSTPSGSLAAPYVGNAILGVFANWR